LFKGLELKGSWANGKYMWKTT